ncbi:MAG: hypothetical protein IV100_14670 [Myxococcales bacterium]|nr:hypothetical protein [Myxococcales bacterium]
MPTSAEDNLVRWDPTSGPMYESHFLKFNLPAEDLALWLRFTVLSGAGGPVFQVWAIAFDAATPSRSFALIEAFPASKVRFERDRLETHYGDCVLTHGSTSGSLDRAGHRLEWDLSWPVPELGLRHFPHASMYTGPLPKTKLLTPVQGTEMCGVVVIDGRRVAVSRAPGMQGHNWGARHAKRWVWVHASGFAEDPTAVFEGVSSKIQLAGIETPMLTMAHLARAGHETITVNGLTEMVRARSTLEDLTWRFRAHSGEQGLEGHFSADPEQFVGLPYPNPDGPGAICLNSKIASGEVRVLEHHGGVWRLGETFTTTRLAALEIGYTGDVPPGLGQDVKVHTDT